MSVTRAGQMITYTCRRHWPKPAGMTSSAVIEIGERFDPSELTNFDHWLTARFRLYSVRGRGSTPRQRFAVADHPPWELHRAKVLHLEDRPVAAAGLSEPQGAPIAHWSPGVAVRIGSPQRLRS